MFRAKDRAQLDLLKAQLDAIQSHNLALYNSSHVGLKEVRERFERIEQGQSVLKADRDADIARMTDRDIAFGEEFLAMSRRLDAIELSQCKTLSLLAVSVKSPAKSAKKRSKKR